MYFIPSWKAADHSRQLYWGVEKNDEEQCLKRTRPFSWQLSAYSLPRYPREAAIRWPRAPEVSGRSQDVSTPTQTHIRELNRKRALRCSVCADTTACVWIHTYQWPMGEILQFALVLHYFLESIHNPRDSKIGLSLHF